jgi:hypothetical protein
VKDISLAKKDEKLKMRGLLVQNAIVVFQKIKMNGTVPRSFFPQAVFTLVRSGFQRKTVVL